MGGASVHQRRRCPSTRTQGPVAHASRFSAEDVPRSPRALSPRHVDCILTSCRGSNCASVLAKFQIALAMVPPTHFIAVAPLLSGPPAAKPSLAVPRPCPPARSVSDPHRRPFLANSPTRVSDTPQTGSWPTRRRPTVRVAPTAGLACAQRPQSLGSCPSTASTRARLPAAECRRAASGTSP